MQEGTNSSGVMGRLQKFGSRTGLMAQYASSRTRALAGRLGGTGGEKGGGSPSEESRPTSASSSRPSSIGKRSPSCDLSRIRINPSELEVSVSIGTGSTASVFRGSWRGQPVAVKKMLDRHLPTQPAFNREVNILANVDHPNLTKLHGIVTAADSFQFVIELCEGGSLFEMLHIQNEFELEWRQQMKMCHDIAAALRYLHGYEPQIVHRDLKSLNILLGRPLKSPSDVPISKVTDFGLSKFREAGEHMTKGVGSPHWMAPECFARTDYDEKVDVYSYGVVLFEVICCEPPYEQMQPNEVEPYVCGGGRPELEEALPPDCPPQMQALMEACWHQDPKRRPSFEDVLRSLDAIKV